MKNFLKKYKKPLWISLIFVLVIISLSFYSNNHRTVVKAGIYRNYLQAIKQRDKQASHQLLIQYLNSNQQFIQSKNSRADDIIDPEEFCSTDPYEDSIYSLIAVWNEAAGDWNKFIDDNFSDINDSIKDDPNEYLTVRGESINGIALGSSSIATNVKVERGENESPSIVITTRDPFDISFGGYQAESQITVTAADVPYVLDSLNSLANEICANYEPQYIPFDSYLNPDEPFVQWNTFQDSDPFLDSNEPQLNRSQFIKK